MVQQGGNGDFRLDHPEVVSHGKHEIHHILAQPSAHVHLGVGDSPVLPPVADMIERRDDQGLDTLDFFISMRLTASKEVSSSWTGGFMPGFLRGIMILLRAYETIINV
ncbi:MAG: hypothetical protein PHF57_06870 [Methanoregula sp.]|jgi:hypothetical protein|nr:hypothetical protein [Methanoregula sp.]